jgi:hypothetical protein
LRRHNHVKSNFDKPKNNQTAEKQKGAKNKTMKNNSRSIRVAAAIISLVCAGAAYADTITCVIGGSAESGANYVNFDALAGGSTASYTSGALTVTFAGNAQTESSTVNNASEAPYLSGNNNQNFEGSTPVGLDTTTYIAAGNTGGAGQITFNFSGAQTYLGLLWGSIDLGNSANIGNYLTLYSGANGTGSVIETINGDTLAGINTNIDQALTDTGYVGQSGTAYVNINTTAGFESAVLTSGWFTYEVDNVAYGSNSVPDAASSFGLLLVGLGSVVLFGRKWSRRPAGQRQQPLKVLPG